MSAFFYFTYFVYDYHKCKNKFSELYFILQHNPRLKSIQKLFSPLPPHVHIDFTVPSPGCGRSVTDFWGWGAPRAQLRCSDDVSDDMCERGAPGGALNPTSTGYPDHDRYGDLPLQGKIPMVEPGIEPET
jgi:hypothetical protein